MKYPKLREIKGALRSLFTRAYTAKFPFAPHIPSVNFRGKPYYDEKKCIGCTACVNVCPSGALSFRDECSKENAQRRLTVRWDICIECGQCQLNCPTEEGIKLSGEFDISTTEGRNDLHQNIEKEMVICEHCNCPIACKDHIVWTIQKLGPLYTTNTSLINFQQQSLHAGDIVPKKETALGRSDRFRVLCPACRREAVFTS